MRRGWRNMARNLATAALLLAGVAAFAWVAAHPSISPQAPPRRRMTWVHAAGIIAAIALAVAPTPRRWIAAHLQRVRRPSPRARRLVATAIFAIAVAYILLIAWMQDRDLIPKFHDEHMVMLQTRMLAHGRLWTAAHPLADFFETFHVLVKPVYAAIYFPGSALMYVPSVWLGLRFWILPLLIAAAS